MHTAGCSQAEPIFRVEECSLHAVLPLFCAQGVHSPFTLLIEPRQVALACCSTQLDALSSLLARKPAAAVSQGGADAADDAEQVVDRQAAIIAHLLTLNDELAASNCELRTENATLASALERHVAVVASLSSENADMLEHSAAAWEPPRP